MTSHDNSPIALVFGPFRFVPESLELFRNGDRVILAPKPAKALSLLLHHAGRVVRRDELVTALWPDQIVTFDKSLNFTLLQLRRALADDPRQPRYVETLPRIGYRFIGDVQTAAAVERADPPAEGAIRRVGWPPDRRRSTTWLVLAGITLGLTLLAGIALQWTSPHWRRSEGWKHYERATQSLRVFTPAGPARRAVVGHAISELERAVALDPRNAVFWLELAHARFQFDLAPAELRKASEAVDRALALDAQLAGAHLRRGDLRSILEWDWEGSRAAYETALKIDPQFAEAHRHLATYYVIRQDWARAIAHSTTALALEPSSLLHAEAGWVYLYAGRHREALDLCDRALALDSASVHARHCALYASAWSGMDARAAVEAGRLLKDRTAGDADDLSDDPPLTLTAFHRRYVVTAGDSHWDRVDRALMLAALGDAEAALTALEAAVADRLPQVVFRIRDPRLQSLATHQRFERLLHRMGLTV